MSVRRVTCSGKSFLVKQSFAFVVISCHRHSHDCSHGNRQIMEIQWGLVQHSHFRMPTTRGGHATPPFEHFSVFLGWLNVSTDVRWSRQCHFLGVSIDLTLWTRQRSSAELLAHLYFPSTNCSQSPTMPGIQSVLANYERTIHANERVGVQSNMYLSNLARKRQHNAGLPPRGGLRGSRGRIGTTLGNVPESKVPTDITIATLSSSLHDDSCWDDDDCSLLGDLEDGFEDADDDHSLEKSYTSYSTHRSSIAPSQRRPPARGESGGSLQLLAKAASERSLLHGLESEPFSPEEVSVISNMSSKRKVLMPSRTLERAPSRRGLTRTPSLRLSISTNEDGSVSQSVRRLPPRQNSTRGSLGSSLHSQSRFSADGDSRLSSRDLAPRPTPRRTQDDCSESSVSSVSHSHCAAEE